MSLQLPMTEIAVHAVQGVVKTLPIAVPQIRTH
jgi:hypothetical protein